jgi:hypothetical protein
MIGSSLLSSTGKGSSRMSAADDVTDSSQQPLVATVLLQMLVSVFIVLSSSGCNQGDLCQPCVHVTCLPVTRTEQLYVHSGSKAGKR